MGPKVSALFTVCCVIGSGVSPAGTTEPATPILITVQGASSLTPDLQQARAIVSEIYRRAGVELQWEGDPSRAEAGRTLTIVLTTRRGAPAGVGADAMGVAPTPGDGTRGSVAYIFMDAVHEFADSHRVPLSYVVGCAIAHEIGHLLLPPNAHRPDGIMRASWHPGDFPPRSPGVLGFPSDQARLLQRRVQSR